MVYAVCWWYSFNRKNLIGVNYILNEWRLTLEGKELRISRNKTQYIECEFEGRHQEVECMRRLLTINDYVIGEVKNFKYLEWFVQKDGSFDMDVRYRSKCVWMKWRKPLSAIWDKRIPMKLKDKFYRSVIRPIMLYCLKC